MSLGDPQPVSTDGHCVVLERDGGQAVVRCDRCDLATSPMSGARAWVNAELHVVSPGHLLRVSQPPPAVERVFVVACDQMDADMFVRRLVAEGVLEARSRSVIVTRGMALSRPLGAGDVVAHLPYAQVNRHHTDLLSVVERAESRGTGGVRHVHPESIDDVAAVVV